MISKIKWRKQTVSKVIITLHDNLLWFHAEQTNTAPGQSNQSIRKAPSNQSNATETLKIQPTLTVIVKLSMKMLLKLCGQNDMVSCLGQNFFTCLN